MLSLCFIICTCPTGSVRERPVECLPEMFFDYGEAVGKVRLVELFPVQIDGRHTVVVAFLCDLRLLTLLDPAKGYILIGGSFLPQLRDALCALRQ